ncbi:DEAD/DEAH box helicase [Canibacter sp. lx-45]|uniref:DEAD/DEAH box helicase n=1 Tax=Canibacter zhuwentaonis TaxID=2837491 RepID=UPI001BDC66B4|nr:DEAD/DEAH box helicase [Canibacter zhuwentaonis]
MTTFTELGIDTDIARALAESGITSAFPIQEQTIPLAIRRQDIIGQAKTGTGKTYGFGLPLVQMIELGAKPTLKALIVVPTRELAVQVYQDLVLAAQHRKLKIAAIYGGKAYESQTAELAAGTHLVVGTPGRLLDLIGKKILRLADVAHMVLDEADKMLDLGFLPDIEKLFAAVPADRHTMLFSATMPDAIVTLAKRFMRNPVHIRATDPDEGRTQANIRHIIYRAHQLDKTELIGRILRANNVAKTVIFTRTKRQAANLQLELNHRGFATAAVHGDLGQDQREKEMAKFKNGTRKVLLATDIAARGIDVNDVTHVINFNTPDDAETYLHRVGRTGRAGNTGIAVTLVDWDEMHKWALINSALGLEIPEPPETYSSSPHLFSDLDIPKGTKGRITTAAKPNSSRHNTHGTNSNSHTADNNTSAARTTGTAEGAPRRRRRTHSRVNSEE